MWEVAENMGRAGKTKQMIKTFFSTDPNLVLVFLCETSLQQNEDF